MDLQDAHAFIAALIVSFGVTLILMWVQSRLEGDD